MRELSKKSIIAKAIFLGDEEGVCKDLAWSKLTRPTFSEFCSKNGLIIICDGFDGNNLDELLRDNSDMLEEPKELVAKEEDYNYVKEALIPVYLSFGKGAFPKVYI